MLAHDWARKLKGEPKAKKSSKTSATGEKDKKTVSNSKRNPMLAGGKIGAKQ